MNITIAVDIRVIIMAIIVCLSLVFKIIHTNIVEKYKTKRHEKEMDTIKYVVSQCNNHDIESTYIKEFVNKSSKAIGENAHSEIKLDGNNKNKKNTKESGHKIDYELLKLIYGDNGEK